MSQEMFARNISQLRFPEMGQASSTGERPLQDRPKAYTDFGNGIFIVQGSIETRGPAVAESLSKLLSAQSGARIAHIIPENAKLPLNGSLVVILDQGFEKQSEIKEECIKSNKEDLPY